IRGWFESGGSPKLEWIIPAQRPLVIPIIAMLSERVLLVPHCGLNPILAHSARSRAPWAGRAHIMTASAPEAFNLRAWELRSRSVTSTGTEATNCRFFSLI